MCQRFNGVSNKRIAEISPVCVRIIREVVLVYRFDLIDTKAGFLVTGWRVAINLDGVATFSN